MIKKFENFNINESIRDQMVGVSPDKMMEYLYNEMLMGAFRMGFVDGVKKAVELGADFNKLSLSNACSNGHSEMVKYLIENGEDVNKDDGYYTPLGRAIQGGHLDTVKTLVELGADINYITDVSKRPGTYSSNPKRKTMIQLAEDKGRTDIAEYLRSKRK